jgi:hypothetical protein
MIPKKIYLNWKQLEKVASVGEELAERDAGSPCRSQWDKLEDNQVLREGTAKIRHYLHQQIGP